MIFLAARAIRVYPRAPLVTIFPERF